MSKNPKRTQHAREIMRDAPWVSHAQAVRMADAEHTRSRDRRLRDISKLECGFVVPDECPQRMDLLPLELHEPRLVPPQVDQRGASEGYDRWFATLSQWERILRFRTWRFTPDSRRDIVVEWSHIVNELPSGQRALAYADIVGDQVGALSPSQAAAARDWAQRSAMIFNMFDDHIRFAQRGAFFWGLRTRITADPAGDETFPAYGIDVASSTLDTTVARLEDPLVWETLLRSIGIDRCLMPTMSVPMLDELPNDPKPEELMWINAETVGVTYAATLIGGGMGDVWTSMPAVDLRSAHGGVVNHFDR